MRVLQMNICFKLLAIVLLVGIILPSIVYSYSISTITIPSSGIIAGAEIIAQSGSVHDIQAAVNAVAAAGGGTVHIPSGAFDWGGTETVNVTGGVNIIGTGVTILQQTNPAPFKTMFSLSGTNGKPVRISNLELHGKVTTTDDNVFGIAILVTDVIDYRIDHCKFLDFPNSAITVTGTGGCRGVIDHCTFDNPYKLTYGGLWGYGIIVYSNNYWDWDPDITHFLGKYETIPSTYPTAYIEDCTFTRMRHSVASNQLGWYVFRHNTVSQEWNSAVDVHGAGTIGAGGRGAEVYNNTVDSPIGIGFRGGSGVIYDNDVTECSSGVYVARDITGTPFRLMDDLWIWNNNGTFVNYDGYYVEDTNYFLRQPNTAQEGFTYTPYAYPHPLTLST